MQLKSKACKKAMLCLFTAFLLSPNIATQAASVWYRYYDSNGIATISSSVSSSHIQRGYDVLDSRMVLIRHVPAFNAEKSKQNAQSYTQQSQQKEADLRLKQAYTSSRTAEFKKQEALKALQTQINLLQQKSKIIYNEQLSLRRQEQEYIRKGKSVPMLLKTDIQKNDLIIEQKKAALLDLQNNYRETQLKYDRIISRLKLME